MSTPCEIISVPHDDGTASIALILFQFKKHGILLLGAYEEKFDSGSAFHSRFDSMIYTYDVEVEERNWPIVGSIDVDEPVKYTRRIDGMVYWEGDERLGVVDPNEKLDIPTMNVAGTRLAERYLNFLCNGGEEKKFFGMTSRSMKAFLNSLRAQ